MNKLARYIIICAVCAIVIFLVWYFSSILTSILIAAVLSLIGKPLMNFLSRVKIWKFHLGNSLSALITLIFIGGLFSMLIIFIIPLIGRIITEMSNINFDEIHQKLSIPLMKYNIMLHNLFPTMDHSVTLESMIMDQFKGILSFDLFTDAFSSVTTFLAHFVVSAFTIIFVTFFFLKDNNTFTNMILAVVPTRYEDNTKRALESIYKLLVRYFTGICIEAFFITVLNTLGLHFIGGVSLQLALVLTFLSGVLNVIPYIGPILAGAIGTIIGIISHLGGVSDPVIGSLFIKLVLIFFVTHMIDVFLFQPYIYSNSVKAHPLEIFIVILLAGNIAGILGMLVAIPAYTVLRVFAKEFFSNFKVVQKLTDKITTS